MGTFWVQINQFHFTTKQMNINEQIAELQKNMEECGGDYVEYCRKHNRHTLKISLINERTGEEEFDGKSITFLNEDNAISHLALCSKFLELLCEEDNTNWGYKHTSADLVNRIVTPIVDRLNGSCPI